MVCDLISFEHKYMQKRRNEDIIKMTLITALVNLIAAIVKLVAQLLER